MRIISFGLLGFNLTGWLVVIGGFILLATGNTVNSVIAFIIGGGLLCFSRLVIKILDRSEKKGN